MGLIRIGYKKYRMIKGRSLFGLASLYLDLPETSDFLQYKGRVFDHIRNRFWLVYNILQVFLLGFEYCDHRVTSEHGVPP